MAKFELVSKFKDTEWHLPSRATKHAAGYDLYAIKDTLVPSYQEQMEILSKYIKNTTSNDKIFFLNEIADITKTLSIRPTLVSTGMKVKLGEDEYLELSARSSTPLKHWLIVANSVGIIDADYYNNPSNEGEIFFQFINLGPVPVQIKAGEFIGQGIIHKFEKIEDDCAGGERQGGFGSSH